MSQSIYPVSLADLHKKNAGKKYRPSNGMEGEFFFDAWCRHCQNDKAMRDGLDLDECDDTERCDIIANTFAHDVEDDEYPNEWQFGRDGQPCCTAFLRVGDHRTVVRDDLTIDMFGGTP